MLYSALKYDKNGGIEIRHSLEISIFSFLEYASETDPAGKGGNSGMSHSRRHFEPIALQCGGQTIVRKIPEALAANVQSKLK